MVKVLVVYDVSDDRDRMNVSRTLQKWGLSRIQRSAFAGNLLRARVKDLARKLEKLIDTKTDIIHIFTLTPIEWNNAIIIGKPLWLRAQVAAFEII